MQSTIKILFLVTFVFLPFIVFVILPQIKKVSGFESGGEGGGMLLSKVPDVCSDLGNRTDCLTAKGCGWCESAGMCMKASHANQCESGMVMPPKTISGFAGGAVMPNPCELYKDCASCADTPSCGWCQTDKKCKLEDRWGASGGKCRPEGAFITASNTCDSIPDTGGPIIVGGRSMSAPVSSELLDDAPANRVDIGSRAPAPVGAQPPAGEDLKVASSPEPARRNMPATGAINAPPSGTVAAAATKSAIAPTIMASGSGPQVASCGTKVSFKLSELPAIEAKVKADILKVLQSTRA